MRFTWAHSSSLSKSLWMAYLPSSVSAASLSLVSSQNFLRVHLVPLSTPLMKILNNIVPSTDPRGTPLVTGFHLDNELLTVTLCTQPSSQFLTHLTAHQTIPLQFRSKNVVGDHIKGLTEVQVNDNMYITERAIMPLLSKFNCAVPTNFIYKASFPRYRLKVHVHK